MKQARTFVTPSAAQQPSGNRSAETTVYLDRDGCTRNFRHFSNVLNRRIYGNAFHRYGKRVCIIPVVEHDEVHRWHYHAAIDCPAHIEGATFSALVAEAWAETDFGHREIDVKADADKGWVAYMLKRRSKDEYDLCIDWLNFHNPLTAVA